MTKNADMFYDVVSDLKKYAERTATNAAKIVRDELYDTAKKSIVLFYKDYPNPIVYNRNYDNFNNNAFAKVPIGRGLTKHGGIEFTPEKMDELYNADASWVYDLVMIGVHGLPPWYQKKQGFVIKNMSPSPLDIIANKRNKLLQEKEYIVKLAKDKARSEGGYNILF